MLTLNAIKAAAVGAKGTPGDVLNTLLRSVLTAAPGKRLLILDYGSVEARGVAWCAGEEALLAVFRDPHADVYCEMASRVYGRVITKRDPERNRVGKPTILGAGYGMGAPKFATYCALAQIDLAAAGVTAEQCIEAYRDAYPAIAGVKSGKYRRGGLWKGYQKAAMGAVQKGDVRTCGRCRFFARDGHLVIELPSGREMMYRNAAVAERVPGYCAMLGLPEVPRPTLVYTHPHGYEGMLYGGLLCENIVQAICRDLLATAIVLLEHAGLPVVLHVHDEVVCEVEKRGHEGALREAARIMSTPPKWAEGFPVVVEGFAGVRYTKAPFKEVASVTAMCGRCE